MTLAAQVRRSRGLSVRAIARRTGLHPDTLRRFEREGAPFDWAGPLARIYGCPPSFFEPGRFRGPMSTKRRGGARVPFPGGGGRGR
jgi:transcriptional regulator with XRE-family HTH domain